MPLEQTVITYHREFAESPHKKAIDAVISAVQSGNRVLRDWFVNTHQNGADLGAVHKAGDFSSIGFDNVVTKADTACEEAIIPILKHCMDIPVCAEETGHSVPEATLPNGSKRWLIDPLDATFCFKNGKPDFSITIALQEKVDGQWQTLVGAVSVPMHDEIYLADDKNAFLIQGQRCKKLSINATDPAAFSGGVDEQIKGKKIESVIFCKTPEKKEKWLVLRQNMLDRLGESAQDTFSGALMIAKLADGWLDGIVLAGSALDFDWDTKAAIHIAEKAGAKTKIIEIDGEPCFLAANTTSLLNALEHVVKQECQKSLGSEKERA